MSKVLITTISVHPDHMSHIIGKNGSNIRKICEECHVTMFNPPYVKNQKNHVNLTIEGRTHYAIHQALYRIERYIASKGN